MSDVRLDLRDACEKSIAIVTMTPEMGRLYHEAVRYIGLGELRNRILDLAAEAIQEKDLGGDVFVNDESILSFFCGIWIQFLLVEIGGFGKEELRSLAQRIFTDMQRGRTLH